MSSELKKASVGPVYIGAIIVFALFGLVVWIAFGIMPKGENFEQKRGEARLAKLNVMEKENHEKLSGYAWVNQPKGVVQLPIDRAQELVVAELKAKPVKASSVKVDVPYPFGLQQPAVPAASGTAVPATTGSAAPAPAASAAPAAPAVPAATITPAPSATPAAEPSATPATASPATSPA